MRRVREYVFRKEKVNFTFHTWVLLLPSENTGKQHAKLKIVSKNICTLSMRPPFIQNIKLLPNNNRILKTNFDLHMIYPESTGTNMNNLCYE